MDEELYQIMLPTYRIHSASQKWCCTNGHTFIQTNQISGTILYGLSMSSSTTLSIYLLCIFFSFKPHRFPHGCTVRWKGVPVYPDFPQILNLKVPACFSSLASVCVVNEVMQHMEELVEPGAALDIDRGMMKSPGLPPC